VLPGPKCPRKPPASRCAGGNGRGEKSRAASWSRFAEASRATPRGVPRASPPPTRGARRLPTLSRCPAGQTSLASVATAITIAVPKAPMQENSTVSITTLIICTLPSCAASSRAIAKPLRDVGRKVAAAILNPGGIRFPPSVAVAQHGRSRRHLRCRRLGSDSSGADPAGQPLRFGYDGLCQCPRVRIASRPWSCMRRRLLSGAAGQFLIGYWIFRAVGRFTGG
jgi:hypothetical protein